ncbi:MAG: lysylphosphatidylglycerol synthase transmembrane domain-containing protein [bacterium]
MNRRIALSALGFLISAVLLWLMLRTIQFHEIQAAIASVTLPILVCSLVSRLLGFVFMASRTRVLMDAKVSFPDLLRGQLAGFAGNNLLPLRLGELVRVAYLARRSDVPQASWLAVAGLERLFDMMTLMAMFLLVAPLALGDVPKQASFLVLGVGVLCVTVVTLIVARYPRRVLDFTQRVLRPLGPRFGEILLSRSSQFIDGLAGLRSWRRVSAATLASLCYWAMSVVSVQIWIAAFGLTLPWYAPVFVIGMLAFGTALPSAPGFVGTWHYLCQSALVIMAVPKSTAVAFSLVGHFMTVVPFTVLALFVLGTSLFREQFRQATRL